MDSCSADPEESFRGDYHAHPYGEFNLVIPLTDRAMLAGPNGWCHAGWTIATEPDTSEFSMRILSVPGFRNHMLANFHVLAVICRNVDHDYAGCFERFA